MRTLPAREADVETEGKPEGLPLPVAGRVEELRRLEAAERALGDAFADYARATTGGARLLYIAERHHRHAELLAERIRQLGGRPEVDPDDVWILGPTRDLQTLINAERQAHRTFHDHLVDLDPETRQLVRNRILPEHEQTLDELTGEPHAPQELG